MSTTLETSALASSAQIINQDINQAAGWPKDA